MLLIFHSPFRILSHNPTVTQNNTQNESAAARYMISFEKFLVSLMNEKFFAELKNIIYMRIEWKKPSNRRNVGTVRGY